MHSDPSQISLFGLVSENRVSKFNNLGRDRVAGRPRFRLFRGLLRYLYWYGVAITRGKIFGRRARWRR
jgi:hypothetical protein